MNENKRNRLLFILVIAIAVFSIAACGQPPEEEMAAARQAVENAAGNPDVPRYAPDTLDRARGLLSEMEAASENREYDSARSLAQEATQAAEQAVQDAAAAKDRARSDAEAAISAAESDLAEARGALEDAQGVAGVRLDFRAIRRELEAAAESVATARENLEAEEFSDAQTGAESARTSISRIMRRISDAVQAATRK